MDCSSCKARHNCMAVVEPGSIACMAHLLQAGGTKADGNPYQTRGVPKFCPICGKPLKVIGAERFCNYVQCENRYIPMEGRDRSWMK